MIEKKLYQKYKGFKKSFILIIHFLNEFFLLKISPFKLKIKFLLIKVMKKTFTFKLKLSPKKSLFHFQFK
jgi:hypothetical protein